jgi:hypothetical protein
VDVSKSGHNYYAHIVAGLPTACHSPDTYRVQRAGSTIRITVWNEVQQADFCAFVYSTYNLNINLGSDFNPGTTYTVIVNNEVVRNFVAH